MRIAPGTDLNQIQFDPLERLSAARSSFGPLRPAAFGASSLGD
jgi:hypothetical protein